MRKNTKTKNLLFWSVVAGVFAILNILLQDFWIALCLHSFVVLNREIMEHEEKEGLLFTKRHVAWDILWLALLMIPTMVQEIEVSIFFFVYTITNGAFYSFLWGKRANDNSTRCHCFYSQTCLSTYKLFTG